MVVLKARRADLLQPMASPWEQKSKKPQALKGQFKKSRNIKLLWD